MRNIVNFLFYNIKLGTYVKILKLLNNACRH